MPNEYFTELRHGSDFTVPRSWYGEGLPSKFMQKLHSLRHIMSRRVPLRGAICAKQSTAVVCRLPIYLIEF